MSSNLYPQPPKFTPANDLMKKKVSPRPNPDPEDIATASSETTAELGSMFPTVPVTPEPDEKTISSTSKNEDTEASKLEEVLSSEASETGAPRQGDSEPPEGASSEELEKEDAETDTYGGALGIIKHTGYVTVGVWAVLTAVVTGVTAHFLAPGDYTWIALGVLGFMTGVIAAVDRKTHLIKNQHTVATAILTVPLSLLVAFNLGVWNFLFGLIAAVAVFGVFIFLILKVNFGSGGDIKFSPVPAFALGVVNPLISALWLFYALIITVVLLVVRKEKSTSFGEGMAISLPFAVASVFALYAMTGLPYMEPVTP